MTTFRHGGGGGCGALPRLALLALLAAAVLLPCGAIETARRPHILFIVIDDLGFDDVGFRSHQIQTPTIDLLARRGVVLNQYYVQDVCSPSRATFMTGRYAMHHSVVDWIPPGSAYGLPLNETTLAEKMASAGYEPHAVGKWHLGFYKWEMTPTFRGFRDFTGFYSGGEDYFTHQSSGAYDFRRDVRERCGANCSQVFSEAQGRYSTTVFTEAAVEVVQKHDPSKPLFLYLAYQGVHAPAQVPQRYINPYNDTIADPKRRTFAGMLSAVDEGIANVTAALREKGMDENLLVVFTSDNGGPTTTGDGVGARNWPLRGGKHSIWEGGVRATAFVTGAGVRQGGEYDGLMHGADWFATLSDVAGYNLSGTLPLDSTSQWRALTGDASTAGRQKIVLGNSTDECSWHKGDPRRARYEDTSAVASSGAMKKPKCGFAIRKDENGHSWKLILGYGGAPDTWCNTSAAGPKCRPFEGADCPNGWCLYDVAADPLELSECSQQHADVVKDMQRDMANVLKTYRQYEIDPSCPQHTFPEDPAVGKYWGPWCG